MLKVTLPRAAALFLHVKKSVVIATIHATAVKDTCVTKDRVFCVISHLFLVIEMGKLQFPKDSVEKNGICHRKYDWQLQQMSSENIL